MYWSIKIYSIENENFIIKSETCPTIEKFKKHLEKNKDEYPHDLYLEKLKDVKEWKNNAEIRILKVHNLDSDKACLRYESS